MCIRDRHKRAPYYATLNRLHQLHQSGNAQIRITHEDTVDYIAVAGRP